MLWQVGDELGSYEWCNWLSGDALYTLHTYIHTSICCILIWSVFVASDKEALLVSPLLLSTTTLTAAPRGNHSGIIIGIQFGFVNVDRALLHSGSRVRLKWSSAFSCSVASLSSGLLSSAAADRRPSHSFFPERTFFFFFLPVSCRRSSPGHSVPGPTFWLPLWVWNEESAAYAPRSAGLGPCDSTSTGEIVQTRVKQPTGPVGIGKASEIFTY